MSEPEVQLQEASPKTETPPSNPEKLVYKNRLQEFAQRSSIPLPIYRYVNEGQTHVPQFRVTVFVDGMQFVSENTFSHLKAAEQDAAKLALSGIYKKTKADVAPYIFENLLYCKSILMEYTVKMNFEKPIYTTGASDVSPFFVSEVSVNGVKFKGENGKNKKEAEHLAARAAMLAILDSGSRTVLSEIIKSKVKHLPAWNNYMSQVQSSDVAVNKRKEMEVPVSATILAVSETNHLFNNPKAEVVIAPSSTPPPPIVFVPPVFIETESGPIKKRFKNNTNVNPEVPVEAPAPTSSPSNGGATPQI